MRERERGRGRGREGEGEGEGGGYVTLWHPSMTKAVLIKLRRKTFTWVVRACLPDMDKSNGG
jgi:hypothetical protein